MFDVQAVRQQFPALSERFDGKPAVFFDNPGGTQVHESVIRAMTDYMTRRNANTHGVFATSRLSDEVIGYTDDRGSSSRNSSLSQQRADKVRDALVMRGVPAEKLVSIGRNMQIDISSNTGTNSPNRRVEFEVGFKGEGAR